MQRFAINAFLLAAVLAICTLTMEYSIRLLFPVYDPSGQVRFVAGDTTRPNLGEPSTVVRQTKLAGDYDVRVVFNKFGFRDRRELSSSSEADFFVVGDSFSFGWGVEEDERYSDVFERLHGQTTFNISIPGDLTEYQKLIAYAQGKGGKVRNLIVGLCMENDLLIYGSSDKTSEITPRSAIGRGMLGRLKEFLASQSAAYKMIASLVHRTPALRRLVQQAGLIAEIEKSVPGNAFDIKIVDATLSKLKQITTSFDATILVIPSRGLWLGAHTYSANQYHNAMVEGLRDQGFRFVDMRPIFEQDGDPIQYHFANDGHWNAAGHALAAKALHDFMEANPQ